MKQGKFITIEGTEGAGKSTALGFMKEYITMQIHEDVLITREPGGTEIAEQIRQILLYPKTTEKLQPDSELLLMFASRAQHIAQCIKPALQSGKWVICDRYIDASYAYQSGGRGIQIQFVQTLDSWIVGELYPDLTILLDVPAELGMQRTESRDLNSKDRIEMERIEFFIKVRNTYLDRANSDPKRIKVIDATQSLEKVQREIKAVLDKYL